MQAKSFEKNEMAVKMAMRLYEGWKPRVRRQLEHSVHLFTPYHTWNQVSDNQQNCLGRASPASAKNQMLMYVLTVTTYRVTMRSERLNIDRVS